MVSYTLSYPVLDTFGGSLELCVPAPVQTASMCPTFPTMRIGGGTPEKRRESTRNYGKRRDCRGARTTVGGPQDTPSLRTGHVYSFSPADCLQRKILAQSIQSLIGCLLLLPRGCFRLCLAHVPPPKERNSWAPCSRREERGRDTAHVGGDPS